MPVLSSYTKLEDAHLAVSLLQGNGVEAWLRDEATANLYWLYSNAIGGVKVEVAEQDLDRAREILQLPKVEDPGDDALLRCPYCDSQDVRLREMNLVAALALIFLNLILPGRSRTADCGACGKCFRLGRTGR